MKTLLPLRLIGLLLVVLLAGTPAPIYAQSATVPASASEATRKTPTLFDSPALVKQFQETITPEELAAHLYIFASDSFQGRETGMPGQKLAAAYLATQYRKMGLQPKGTAKPADARSPEAYYQPFTVYGQRLQDARLTVIADGKTVASTSFGAGKPSTSAYLMSGSQPETAANVVFIGYGIADNALGYNDYAAASAAGIHLAGKWLLMLNGEPLESASKSLLPTQDGGPSAWSTNRLQKIRAALSEARPAGILIVGDVGPLATASLAEQSAHVASGLTKIAGSLSLTDDINVSRGGTPIYVISTELADKILAPSNHSIAALRQDIDADLTPVVFEVNGASVQSTIKRQVVEFSTENVLAYIEGSDPELKDEVIVISSHYDHEGIDPFKTGDQIYNGADDDGSGTVTTLEIAEAFMEAKRAGHGPRRSILFLNVAAEEKGLLGSEYYTDVQPVIPLENTVTNLNIDMIGRYDPTHPTGSKNYVYLIGSKLISQELHDIIVRANELTGTDLDLDERFNSKDDPNRFYARSDHWNFGKYGIPFTFFFTGTHEDYHGVGDEPDKIDYERMARIARTIFATAWQVANQDERPKVSGKGFH